jgi:phosphatidylinositol alpha-mannosyltransferase
LGPAGLSFRNGDPEDLAIKLQRLLDDDRLREQMIMAGEKVLSRYHPDTILSQVLQLYEELLS